MIGEKASNEAVKGTARLCFFAHLLQIQTKSGNEYCYDLLRFLFSARLPDAGKLLEIIEFGSQVKIRVRKVCGGYSRYCRIF